MQVFEYLRNKYLEKIKQTGKRLSRGKSMRDGYIINTARTNLGLDLSVVRANFYIRFEIEQEFNVRFRIPNSTTIAVFDPQNCVDPKSIEPVLTKPLSTT